MNDKISGINAITPKNDIVKAKKAENTNPDIFSKILESAVAKTDSSKGSATSEVQNILQPSYINPLHRIEESNSEAVKFVEENLDNILSNLELFSSLMGDSSIAIDDIAPLAGKIKEDINSILKYSEQNNIPNDLKSIVKESSALAYAAAEKLNNYM